jgi:hypothetical protein
MTSQIIDANINLTEVTGHYQSANIFVLKVANNAHKFFASPLHQPAQK